MLELPLGNAGWENPLVVGENPARKQQKKKT